MLTLLLVLFAGLTGARAAASDAVDVGYATLLSGVWDVPPWLGVALGRSDGALVHTLGRSLRGLAGVSVLTYRGRGVSLGAFDEWPSAQVLTWLSLDVDGFGSRHLSWNIGPGGRYTVGVEAMSDDSLETLLPSCAALCLAWNIDPLRTIARRPPCHIAEVGLLDVDDGTGDPSHSCSLLSVAATRPSSSITGSYGSGKVGITPLSAPRCASYGTNFVFTPFEAVLPSLGRARWDSGANPDNIPLWSLNWRPRLNVTMCDCVYDRMSANGSTTPYTRRLPYEQTVCVEGGVLPASDPGGDTTVLVYVSKTCTTVEVDDVRSAVTDAPWGVVPKSNMSAAPEWWEPRVGTDAALAFWRAGNLSRAGAGLSDTYIRRGSRLMPGACYCLDGLGPLCALPATSPPRCVTLVPDADVASVTQIVSTVPVSDTPPLSFALPPGSRLWRVTLWSGGHEGYTCSVCPPFTSGARCEHSVCSAWSSDRCAARGQCLSSIDACFCFSESVDPLGDCTAPAPGFSEVATPNDCHSFPVPDALFPLGSRPCNGHGVCGTRCLCTPLYSGPACENFIDASARRPRRPGRLHSDMNDLVTSLALSRVGVGSRRPTCGRRLITFYALEGHWGDSVAGAEELCAAFHGAVASLALAGKRSPYDDAGVQLVPSTAVRGLVLTSLMESESESESEPGSNSDSGRPKYVYATPGSATTRNVMCSLNPCRTATDPTPHIDVSLLVLLPALWTDSDTDWAGTGTGSGTDFIERSSALCSSVLQLNGTMVVHWGATSQRGLETVGVYPDVLEAVFNTGLVTKVINSASGTSVLMSPTRLSTALVLPVRDGPSNGRRYAVIALDEKRLPSARRHDLGSLVDTTRVLTPRRRPVYIDRVLIACGASHVDATSLSGVHFRYVTTVLATNVTFVPQT